jgi:hypothetical protein
MAYNWAISGMAWVLGNTASIKPPMALETRPESKLENEVAFVTTVL